MSNITIQIGRVETLFLLSLLGYVLASFLWPRGGTTPVLGLASIGFGTWVAIRLARRFARVALWGLRNRLIAAYFFIGFVPLLLSLLLLGLGAYLMAGQLSIYLITSELDRQTAYLRGPLAFLVREDPRRKELTGPVISHLEERYPGLRIVSDAPRLDGTHGLLVREGLMHGWARAEQGERSLLALFPISPRYLGTLAPNLGETRMLSLARGANLHGTPEATPGNLNRVPPAMNSADILIFSTSAVTAVLWDNPAQTEEEYIAILTRPSALFRTIVSERTGFASDWVTITFYGVAVLFFIALVIAMVVGVSITRNVTTAVDALYEGTGHITAGDFRHRIPNAGPDQLGALATSFNAMTENLERLFQVEKERERLQNELEIAREVQNQLYPKSVPESKAVRLTAVCHPARIVSGDFYDYQRVGPGRIALSVGDVAGKGISAALLMATIQSSFRTQLRNCDSDARSSELVSQLNKQVHAFTAAEKYATFFFGVINEETSQLVYTNAGHLPPYLVRGVSVSKLDVNGMVVGAFPFATYDESSIKLESGDLLCFYTDGITEPENDYGEMFGEDRLAELLCRNARLDDKTLLELIVKSALQWSGTQELQDDMTVLLVRKT